MKKTIFFLFCILLTTSIVSAGQINPLKTDYIIGETIQSYYSNETLNSANIYLLDSNQNKITISPLLLNYKEDNYFFYFNIPTTLTAGNYTLIANNDKANLTFSEGLSITIKPAFITLNDDTFLIAIKNNAEESITTEISTNNPKIVPRKTILSFTSKEEKNLYSDYSDIETSSELYITYNAKTYTIPLYYPYEIEQVVINETITINETIEENITTEVNPIEFLTTQSEHSYTLYPEDKLSGELPIKNNLNEVIQVTITLTENLKQVITTEQEITIEPDTYYKLPVLINNNTAEKGEYQGDIIITYQDYSLTLPIEVTIIEEDEGITQNVSINWSLPEEANTEQETSGVSSSIILGLVLAIILIALIIIIYLKIQPPPSTRKFEDVINERTK